MRKLIARLLARLSAALNTVEAKVEPVLAPIEQAVGAAVESITTTIKDITMAKQITDTGSIALALALVSAAGNPVTDPVTLTSSDPTIVTAALTSDGKGVLVTAAGKLGTATVTATAGALTATYEITVVVGPAAKLTLDEVAVA
jgi:hypothetical protein